MVALNPDQGERRGGTKQERSSHNIWKKRPDFFQKKKCSACSKDGEEEKKRQKLARQSDSNRKEGKRGKAQEGATISNLNRKVGVI